MLYKVYAGYKLLFRRPVYILWRYIDLEFIFTNKFKVLPLAGLHFSVVAAEQTNGFVELCV